MENHLDIFNDLYAIKDKISDNDFLVLNNKIKKLIQENKDLRDQRTNDSNGEEEEEDEEIEEYEEYEVEEDEEEEDPDYFSVPGLSVRDLPRPGSQLIEHQCHCERKWVFSLTNRPEGELYNYFCFQTDQQMLNCSNFKKLLELLPHLENLFHKIDLPFVEEPIEQEFAKDQLIFTVRVLLSIIDQISGKRRKSIITFVIYDLLIRNANFLRNNQKFLEATIRKMDEFLRDDDYISLAELHCINIQKWKDIMTSLM